jgi:hypothetical protein
MRITKCFFLVFVVLLSLIPTTGKADDVPLSSTQSRSFVSLDFFIKDIPISTGLIQFNEGALAVNGEQVFVIHRQGEVELFNGRTLSLTTMKIKVPFQDFEQRAWGERGAPGVKGAMYDPLTSNLFVSATFITEHCAHLALYGMHFNTEKQELEKPRTVFITPTCAPLPILDPGYPLITAANRQGCPNISQAGGKIISYSNPGTFLLTIGNFGDDWRTSSDVQRLKTSSSDLFGKIVKLQISSNLRLLKSQVFATGFRNPSGLTWSSFFRKIVEVENGPDGGDEINYVSEGADYGWPVVSLGNRYSGPSQEIISSPYPPTKQGVIFGNSISPVFAWSPSIAPSNLTPMPKNLSYGLPNLTEFIIGTYRDQSLHRVLASANSIISDERIQLGYRIRDLLFNANDQLIILDDAGYLHILDFVSRKKQSSGN